MSGDIIVDLEEMAGMPAAVCGQEVTTVFYTAMEESCDYVETHVQTITRVDTMGPHSHQRLRISRLNAMPFLR